jgi:hypothetical protein
MKKIYFVRTRPVTHGDLANLLEMLGEGVSPAHKASGDGYGAGGIAYTTTEPEHKYKYVRFTGADLPDTSRRGRLSCGASTQSQCGPRAIGSTSKFAQRG